MKRDDKKETGARKAEGTDPAAPRNRLEKLKAVKKYAAPVLLSLSGSAAAVKAAAPEGVPPPPIPIPTLGGVGVGLLVGGLAVAGGVMAYRKNKANQQDHEDDPDDSSKK